MQRQLKFPSYEFLESLPLKQPVEYTYLDNDELFTATSEEFIEYKFTIFETPVDCYGRFTLNEDDSGMIHFDVMEDDYCDHNNFGKWMTFNKKNYAAICEYAQSVYDLFFKELEKDLSYQWENKTVAEFVDLYGN